MSSSAAKSDGDLRWRTQPQAVEIIRDLVRAMVATTCIDVDVRDEGVLHVVEPLVSRTADWPEAIRHWCVDGPSISHERVHRSCPLCAGEEATRLFDTYEGFTYVACRRCSLWYIPDYVPDEAWARYQAEDELIVAIHDRQFDRALAAGGYEPDRERFTGYLDWIEGLVGEPLSGRGLLDLGSLTGNAVRVAAGRGLRAVGVEWGRRAVEATRRASPTTDLKFLPPGRRLEEVVGDQVFDLATVWETLEHLPDPVGALRDLGLHVRPGGWLALTVPNVESYVAAVMREHCFYAYGGVDHQGHLNLFSAATLAEALEQAGFELVFWETEFSTSWLDALSFELGRTDLVYCMKNVAEGQLERSKRPSAAERLAYSFGPTLTRIEAALRVGPMIKALARRSGGAGGGSGAASVGMGFRRRALETAAIVEDLRAQLRSRDERLSRAEAERLRIVEHLQGEVDIRDRLLNDLNEASQCTMTSLQAEVTLRDQLLHDAVQERIHDLRELQAEVNKRDDLLQELSRLRTEETEGFQRHIESREAQIAQAAVSLARLEDRLAREAAASAALKARMEATQSEAQQYGQREIKVRDAMLQQQQDAYRTMAETLQQAVNKRDALLGEAARERGAIVEALQQEINKRDALLSQATQERVGVQEALQQEIKRRDALLGEVARERGATVAALQQEIVTRDRMLSAAEAERRRLVEALDAAARAAAAVTPEGAKR